MQGRIVSTTENSGMGGSYKVEEDEAEKLCGATTCLEAGAELHVNPEMRLGTSRCLRVSPARMTLSEFAMHSMQSNTERCEISYPE